MAASATDYFSKTYQRLTTTLSADKGIGASSMTLNSATNFPTTTGIKVSVYNLDTNGDIDTSTLCVYRGTVSGSAVTNLTLVEGTDQLHSAGATVSLLFTATHWNDLVTGLTTAGINQDGTQTPVVKTSINDVNGNEVIKTPATTSAVNEITVTNAATGSNPSISATGGDTNISLNLKGKGTGKPTIGTAALQIFPYDYVASGCVWSGDAYASTRAASMTSGTIVINGNPLTVAAVSARSFTASKDTYVDASDNGDGTALLTYTEVTNNAASPALSANYVRLAIIVTGASNIADVGSINQGQENKVLPIASSVPYAVTDSLGNLICPRDPQRKILGYRQILTDATGTTIAQVTGLSCPVIVPTGRKVKITAYATSFYNSSSGQTLTLSLWSGAVSGGTQIGQGSQTATAANEQIAASVMTQTTPASSSVTYNLGATSSGGTWTVRGVSTGPAFIRVELV